MENLINKIFICFSALDRYNIAQPIVYHLKNYGIDVWYDRYEMVMGDNRLEKNIDEGARKCRYALIIFSVNTINSICATEEIKVLESRFYKGEVIIFPILYELKPCDLPTQFVWIKSLIFKEVNRTTGTLEVCNHVACKMTCDILNGFKCKSINEIVSDCLTIPKSVRLLLKKYLQIDTANLNSRVSLLYAIYIIITEHYGQAQKLPCEIPIKAFDWLFNETLLNLAIDYRELWLLENSICILIGYNYSSCIESKI